MLKWHRIETALEVARRGFSTYAGVRSASNDGGLAKAASKDGLEIKIIPMDVDDDSRQLAPQ